MNSCLIVSVYSTCNVYINEKQVYSGSSCSVSKTADNGGSRGEEGNSWTILDFSYKIPNLSLLI